MQSHPFYTHFAKIYGPRWEGLFAALTQPERQIARWNTLSAPLPAREPSLLQGCFPVEGSPQRNEDGLLDTYIMDPASVLVARALDVQAGDRVLDMCAAPGGKTLILIEALRENGEIFANDLSPERRERLKKVIQQYVPRDIRDRVWVTGKDGVQFGLREPESFDRILLDAPCSGERHVLENKKALEEWSPRRGEHLASRQYALLAGALLAIKPGGRIVYSTCSINPEENDGVLKKLLKKKKDQVKLLSANEDTYGEKTECGVMYLPDHCGFGPLFLGVIEKT